MWILTDSSFRSDQVFYNLDNYRSVEFVEKDLYTTVSAEEHGMTEAEAESSLEEDDPGTLYFCALTLDGSYDLLKLIDERNQAARVEALQNAVREALMSGAALVDLRAVLSGI